MFTLKKKIKKKKKITYADGILNELKYKKLTLILNAGAT